MTGETPILSLHQLRFGFPGRPAFLGPITLTVQRGDCWAIVGPNGAGKSTLLRLMAGLLRPWSGDVDFVGRPLSRISLGVRARRIAFLPQQGPVAQDHCVRELVMMGRFPHRTWGFFESADDVRAAEQAMDITQVREFAVRQMSTLSGGESQRVYLAAALAQEPELLLLDEPTASLDLRHQLAVFGILRDQVRKGLTAVVVTHDVNLAGRFCTHVLLLHEGKSIASGTPDDVLTPATLGDVYGVPLVRLAGATDHDWLVPILDDGAQI